jgi:LAO/AO transport system kinase
VAGLETLAADVAAGRTRALARAISIVEANGDAAAPLLRELYPRTGRAVTIGVTGFPGAGKSSLTDRLIERLRAREQQVGVIAVDPSSAFSGGAILGDRVRMMSHADDPGVFIRSMATRGHLGGLAAATGDVLDLLDAAGRDVILVETVGVGQDEIEVTRLADVVLVVLVPGMGDEIQAIKAGILEIADLFVINKADREGADKLVTELEHMLGLVEDERPRPPILKTVATRGEGVDELVAAIDTHLAAPRMAERRGARRHERARARLEGVLHRTLLDRLVERGVGPAGWEQVVADLAERRTDPYSATERILRAAGTLSGEQTGAGGGGRA